MNILKTASKTASFLLFFFLLLVVFGIPAITFSKFEFIRILQDKTFLTSALFSIKTASTATLFSAIFGIPAGFYLARNKGVVSFVMDSFFDIPVIIPPLIIGVLLLNFFNLGIIKSFFQFIFTFKGAVVAQFFISFPFTLKASKSVFEVIPTLYEDIAMTLGATPVRSFLDTTFKLSFEGIISGIMLSWIRCFGEFGATLLVGGGIAGKTENIPINIYMSTTEGNFEKSITASLLVVASSMVFVLILKSSFLKKIGKDKKPTKF